MVVFGYLNFYLGLTNEIEWIILIIRIALLNGIVILNSLCELQDTSKLDTWLDGEEIWSPIDGTELPKFEWMERLSLFEIWIYRSTKLVSSMREIKWYNFWASKNVDPKLGSTESDVLLWMLYQTLDSIGCHLVVGQRFWLSFSLIFDWNSKH